MRNARAEKLKRKTGNRAPRRIFTLFCEGARTEPDYFKALGRTLEHNKVQIKLMPGVGVPYTIAETAAKWVANAGLIKRRNMPQDPYVKGDQVWAVFDRDEHPRFEEAVQLCEQNNIRVARSNPCFEIWLILHHEDCHAPLTRQQAQRRLGQLCPEYDRSGTKRVDAAKLIPHIVAAEGRAHAHLAQRAKEGAAFGPASTTVYLLTQALRATA